MPSVGQYDIERSRNFLMTTSPQWTLSKSRKGYFNEQELLMKSTLPGIGKYEVMRGFKGIHRPYAKNPYNIQTKLGSGGGREGQMARTFYLSRQ